MSNNGREADHDDDLAKERELLTSLIEQMKRRIDESKQNNKYQDTHFVKNAREKCATAYGLLEEHKAKSKKSSRTYTEKILTLNKRISEMENELSAHKRTISTISFQKEEQEKFFKTREDKDIEKYLKKAQSVNPRLYDIGCYNDNLALTLAPESEKTIRLAQESRSKIEYCLEIINDKYWNIPVSPQMKAVIEHKLNPTTKRLSTVVSEFYHTLTQEMVEDLKYFKSLKHEVESLQSQRETQKTQFSNKIDRISREYYYVSHMNAILGVYTKLDEVTNLQCDYLEALEKCQPISRTDKIDKVWKQKESSSFRELNDKFFKIQDLKAQLQDKDIAISELKKLIKKMKGKSVDTNFGKPSILGKPPLHTIRNHPVVRQPTPYKFE
ncbi:hypothetical protein Tco_0429088 [Tanacetum coccineum]